MVQALLQSSRERVPAPKAWSTALIPMKPIDFDDRRDQALAKAWTSRLNTPGFATFIPCDAPAMVCLSA